MFTFFAYSYFHRLFLLFSSFSLFFSVMYCPRSYFSPSPFSFSCFRHISSAFFASLYAASSFFQSFYPLHHHFYFSLPFITIFESILHHHYHFCFSFSPSLFLLSAIIIFVSIFHHHHLFHLFFLLFVTLSSSLLP